MIGELTIKRDVLMDLIAAISPMAREYVSEFFEDAVVLLAQTDEGSEGAFLKVAREDLCVYYTHFQDDSSQEILDTIDGELSQSDDHQRQGERCFNVYGKNKRIISLIQGKGFALDMAGYVLEYSLPTPHPVDLAELTVDGFVPSFCADFAELFEKAYARLNTENAQHAKGEPESAERFCRRLTALDEKNAIRSFWHQETLVGCYIVKGNYISDLVVHPRFQNKGYGTRMLKHCIHFLRNDKALGDIRLRVAESNTGARRLYERSGFLVTAHFAEHTYRGK